MKSLISILLLGLLPGYLPAQTQVLWTSWVDPHQPGEGVYLGTRDASGWQIEVLPPSLRFPANYSPSLAVGSDGRRTVAWAALSGTTPKIVISGETENGWSEPAMVNPATNSWQGFPSVAPAGDRAFWVVWEQVEGGSTEIFCRKIIKGDDIGPVMVSPPDTAPNSRPAVANLDGKAVIAWQGWDGSNAQIYSARINSGKVSAREAVMRSPGTDQILPAINIGGGSPKFNWFEDGLAVAVSENSRLYVSTPSLARAPFMGTGTTPWLLEKEGGGWIARRGQEPWGPIASRQRGKRALNPLSYIGYGDSITYGHDSGGDYSRWYGKLLKAIFLVQFPLLSPEFLNEGYPGANTYQLLYGGGDWSCPGVNGVITLHPDSGTILIMGGTNDLGSTSNAIISWQLGVIIDRSRTKNVVPIISNIIPYLKEDTRFNQSSELSIEYLPAMADLKLCPLSDAWQAFMDYYSTEYFWCNLYGWCGSEPWQHPNWDGVHPNWQDGDQKIAEAWFDTVSTLIPTPSPTPTTSPPPSPTPTPFYNSIDSADYDGDGTGEMAIFRPNTGLWAIRGLSRFYFGTTGDIPVSADYDGDRTSDVAVFRPFNGLWSGRGSMGLYYGQEGDIPLPGDYDGDYTCEVAVFRETNGLWSIRNLTRQYFGKLGDIPVPGYYSGYLSARTIGIFRPDNNLWRLLGNTSFYFGRSSDLPLATRLTTGTGDTATIFRPSQGLWLSREGTRVYYGANGDIPVPASYSGSPGNTDEGVFREGLWMVRNTTKAWYGAPTDLPVSGRLVSNPSAAF